MSDEKPFKTLLFKKVTEEVLPTNIGSTSASLLNTVLADTFTLYLKTHNCHWNVKGKEFYQFHKLFQKQYEELYESIDDIAERIREVGGVPTGNMYSFIKNTSIKEIDGSVSSEEMISSLLVSHEELSKKLREIEKQLTSMDDVASSNLIIDRISASDKHAWMLRSLME